MSCLKHFEISKQYEKFKQILQNFIQWLTFRHFRCDFSEQIFVWPLYKIVYLILNEWCVNDCVILECFSLKRCESGKEGSWGLSSLRVTQRTASAELSCVSMLMTLSFFLLCFPGSAGQTQAALLAPRAPFLHATLSIISSSVPPHIE